MQKTVKTLVPALMRSLVIALTLATPMIALADAAPAFSLPDSQGTVISLSQQQGKVVYLDFWASWCGPCRQMAPAFEQAASQLEPAVRLAKVNTEEVQGLGQRFNIRSIPTLALFVGGREVARQAGAMTNPAQIAQWVRANLPR